MSDTHSHRSSFLAIAIDVACEEIHQAWRAGAAPLYIALSPELYAELHSLRLRELVGDTPLLLLDLPVVEGPALKGSAVIVARSPVVSGADGIDF